MTAWLWKPPTREWRKNVAPETVQNITKLFVFKYAQLAKNGWRNNLSLKSPLEVSHTSYSDSEFERFLNYSKLYRIEGLTASTLKCRTYKTRERIDFLRACRARMAEDLSSQPAECRIIISLSLLSLEVKEQREKEMWVMDHCCQPCGGWGVRGTLRCILGVSSFICTRVWRSKVSSQSLWRVTSAQALEILAVEHALQ